MILLWQCGRNANIATVIREYIVHINAHLLPSSLRGDHLLAEGVAVVIDVLRATTTIATALENGARSVVTVREVEEARAEKERQNGRQIVMGGERGSVRIEGFDLANSPLEYTPERIRGATVVLSTTNGTAAVEDARAAQQVLCGSLRNADAVARWIIQGGSERLTLVCAGTHGQLAMEDVLGAGAIIDRLLATGSEAVLTDSARLAQRAWLDARNDPRAALGRADHGRSLLRLGFGADVDFCAEVDRCTAVPILSDRGFVIAPLPSPAIAQGNVNQQLER